MSEAAVHRGTPERPPGPYSYRPAKATGASAAMLPHAFAEGADGDAFVLGQENSATNQTALHSDAADTALLVRSTSGGRGVFGMSDGANGTRVSGFTPNGSAAVQGETAGSGHGVLGLSDQGFGVVGQTANGHAGVHGRSENEFGRGVFGISDAANGWGVAGDANGPNGVGVCGFSAGDHGQGVRGESPAGTALRGETGAGIGLWASATGPGGLALFAERPVQFSSAGLADIRARDKSVTVDPGVLITAESKILATLQGSAGNSRYITNVQKLGNDRFVVHLNDRATGNTQVAWFVIS